MIRIVSSLMAGQRTTQNRAGGPSAFCCLAIFLLFCLPDISKQRKIQPMITQEQIQGMLQLAKEIAPYTGENWRMAVAIACHESSEEIDGWSIPGTSLLCVEHHNPFGIRSVDGQPETWDGYRIFENFQHACISWRYLIEQSSHYNHVRKEMENNRRSREYKEHCGLKEMASTYLLGVVPGYDYTPKDIDMLGEWIQGVVRWHGMVWRFWPDGSKVPKHEKGEADGN